MAATVVTAAVTAAVDAAMADANDGRDAERCIHQVVPVTHLRELLEFAVRDQTLRRSRVGREGKCRGACGFEESHDERVISVTSRRSEVSWVCMGVFAITAVHDTRMGATQGLDHPWSALCPYASPRYLCTHLAVKLLCGSHAGGKPLVFENIFARTNASGEAGEASAARLPLRQDGF